MLCGMTLCMKNGPKCRLCGEKMYSNNKRGICRKHGGSSFDVLTGKCLECGKKVVKRLHFRHAMTRCDTINGIWNKGLGLEDPRIEAWAARQRGEKRPWMSKMVKKLYRDPIWVAKHRIAHSAGQKRRFQKASEIEASR